MSNFKLTTKVIVSAIHPNEPQAKGTVWHPANRSQELEAQALHNVGLAAPTNEAVTVKSVEQPDPVAEDEGDVDTELATLLEGNVSEVNEAIDDAFDDLSAEQLEALSKLEAAGKNRKGVLDHIAQYLDAE